MTSVLSPFALQVSACPKAVLVVIGDAVHAVVVGLLHRSTACTTWPCFRRREFTLGPLFGGLLQIILSRGNLT
jgi:hypothetical protein